MSKAVANLNKALETDNIEEEKKEEKPKILYYIKEYGDAET